MESSHKTFSRIANLFAQGWTKGWTSPDFPNDHWQDEAPYEIAHIICTSTPIGDHIMHNIALERNWALIDFVLASAGIGTHA